MSTLRMSDGNFNWNKPDPAWHTVAYRNDSYLCGTGKAEDLTRDDVVFYMFIKPNGNEKGIASDPIFTNREKVNRRKCNCFVEYLM